MMFATSVRVDVVSRAWPCFSMLLVLYKAVVLPWEPSPLQETLSQR